MNPSPHIHPPEWPRRLMRFFVKREYLEEIEGDMEEIFYENVARLPIKKANRLYAWEMLRLLRPTLVRHLEILQQLNHYPMFKNYFKVSLRGLMKNPVNSFINIFGLAVSIGICVFAYAFTRWVTTVDQFHEHKHTVHLVTHYTDREGTLQAYGKTPRPLGEMMRADFAHITKVCRVEDRPVVVKHGDQVFHQRVRFTDPDFLDMFTFPLKWGAASTLADVNSIILSEDMAIKYFGEQNPVGENMIVIFGKDNTKAFRIAGVAKKFPTSRTISFDFLINIENIRTADPAYDFHDWSTMVNATLIQVDDAAQIKSIEKGMEKYVKLQQAAVKDDWAIDSFGFEPLATLNESSEYIRDDISRSSREGYISIIFMVVIAAFLMALSCSNYINIAIATAAKRLKEIGLRKTIGATRRAVIVQFLAENVVITFFALIIGVIMGVTFFIPGFEQLWHFSMDFKFTDPMLWIFLPLILLLTSIASGIYPSLYISRFQVVGILKGAVKFGQKNPITKIFLCFQLIMACIFITCSVLFMQNNNYLSKRPWGYNQDEILYAKVPDLAAYEQLGALMTQDPDVLTVSGSHHHVGKGHATTVIHFPDHEYEVNHLAVDATYFKTLDLPVKEGRAFNDHEGTDRQAVVVNETFVDKMDWSSALGKQFRIDSTQYEVVGVVKDFHIYSFDEIVQPTIFTVASKEDYRYLSMKVRSGSETKVYKTLQANWSRLFPEVPFDGGHQEDVWGFYFSEVNIHSIVWNVIAFIAIALSTLGVYGLIRLNVEGRTKEFSIRKVLGAGLKNIITSVTRQYIGLFIVALIIGAPAAYFLSKFIITFAYKYHMPITLSGAAMGVTILVAVVLLTVSTQIQKVFKTNPVDGLKVE